MTGRRALLRGALGAVLVAAGAAGCDSRESGAGPGGTGTASPTALPATTAWRPDATDVAPEVKLRAVRLVEALGAWSAGGGGPDRARERLAALGLPAGLAAQAGALRPPADRAALQVVYAQYGGITDDAASVLVVCRQWTRTGTGPVVPGGTTVDVRLTRSRPDPTVTALHPAAPVRPAADLSATARQVLADRRVVLPPAAEADVRGGGVHDSVLRTMLRLGRTYRLDVSVLRSGHPRNVFDTDRPSDHPPGRAFDVWAIDGRAVAAPRTPRALVEAFMRAAADAGSYNVGGPVALPGGLFFSDATHHDHVHVGFDR
ncbi:hypothetical protein [Streptomyces sp. I05A-00742]|uniref:hypothetical protein n=1 Tax=Streptomyces sp. I05A-00742 TaxID=2732853 RepID=UPI00289B3014|nr:hypothetical protein [Streptomyces sp. I05A-00742]